MACLFAMFKTPALGLLETINAICINEEVLKYSIIFAALLPAPLAKMATLSLF
jgi:hypothetical protein